MTPRIETIRPPSRAAWLAERRRDVTASEVAALFGCHPYTTALQLHHEKRGTLPPADRDTPAMRRGRVFERVAVDWLREDRPDWRIDYSTEAHVYLRAPDLRLGATPDLIVEAPEGRGVVQIKTVAPRALAGWANEAGDPEPPLWIALQCELERVLAGAAWGAVAALTISPDFEVSLPLYRVEPVPGMLDAMARLAAAFWDRVARGEEPPADYDRDADLIGQLYAEADPDMALDLSGDDEIASLLARRTEAIGARRTCQRVIDGIDARLKHRMGSAPVAHIGGGRRITWAEEDRKPVFAAGGTARVLRVPVLPEDPL